MFSNDYQVASPSWKSRSVINCASLPSPTATTLRRRLNADLFQNVAGRSQRLGKHGRVILNLIRHLDQIANGKGKEFGKRPVTILWIPDTVHPAC